MRESEERLWFEVFGSEHAGAWADGCSEVRENGGLAPAESDQMANDCDLASSIGVLVNRGSKFGLLGEIGQRTHILRELFGGMLGASPSPPGLIALGHQQVLPIVLAGFVDLKQERLNEPIALEWLLVNRAGAAGDDPGINHHPCQSSMDFQRMSGVQCIGNRLIPALISASAVKVSKTERLGLRFDGAKRDSGQ